LRRSQQLDLTDAPESRSDLPAAVREFQAGALADPTRTIMSAAQER
jgi:hypothetical protein